LDHARLFRVAGEAMKLIYVAGPYRADGWHYVLENILEARKYARALWLKGWAVICPHTNTILMDGPEFPAKVFLDGDIEILKRCDAILMLPRWLESVGAMGEYNAARECGMTIYLDLDEVPDGRA
jgi:Domain of unknown function (DUF4406)